MKLRKPALLLLLSVLHFVTALSVVIVLSLPHERAVRQDPKQKEAPHNIQGVRSYKREFNDLNAVHLAAAKAVGVPAAKDRREADKMKKQLQNIEGSKAFHLDPLTHSIPSLVPRAATLIDEIGRNFQDSLDAKGLPPYKVIVTSVLRTKEDVKRLRRRNVNASENSAHCHATTFDISWVRYHKVNASDKSISESTLKKVLAEVLRDLRNARRCYVKHEVKQGCFHITCRR